MHKCLFPGHGARKNLFVIGTLYGYLLTSCQGQDREHTYQFVCIILHIWLFNYFNYKFWLFKYKYSVIWDVLFCASYNK